MTIIRSILLIMLALLLTAGGRPCSAAVIVNGDFSDFDDVTGLPTGWEHFDYGGLFSPPEHVVDGDERYVLFHENNQLEQTFDLPKVLWLSFEYRLFQEGEGISGVPPDSFQATLYDENFDTLFGAPFGFFTVDHAGMYFDEQYVTVQSLADDWRRVTLDLTSLPPMDGVLLEFLLSGFDDGRTTTVQLDNVAVVVPEPATATIFAGLALCFLPIYRKQRRRYHQSLHER